MKALGIKGVHQVREYKRHYPEGEAAAHVVGFTNVEERGQEGIELRFQKELQGRDGARAVVKDRLGRVVEDIGDRPTPVNGRDITLSIDSKVQFFAYQRIRDAVAEHKAKAGSVVVLDAQTGEVLALANYPSFNPGDRQQPERRTAAQPRADRHLRARLDDEALHRRAGAGDRPRARRDRDSTPRRAASPSPARPSPTRTRTAC